jgi:ferric-dicitrate binding protein FerR (iron transport regulator)
LGPRDVARLTEKGTPVVLHDQNVDRLVAWTNGEIIFDDTALSDVAKELERWFDIECRIADPSLEKLHLTTPFSSGESLEAVLGVIAKSLELRVQRSGRVVTFTRGPTRAAAPPSPATIDNPRRTEAGA